MDIISKVKASIKREKTCMVCEEQKAEFCVKGIYNNCYCKDCAQEQYGDLALLEKLS